MYHITCHTPKPDIVCSHVTIVVKAVNKELYCCNITNYNRIAIKINKALYHFLDSCSAVDCNGRPTMRSINYRWLEPKVRRQIHRYKQSLLNNK